jgi:hypothetical protein
LSVSNKFNFKVLLLIGEIFDYYKVLNNIVAYDIALFKPGLALPLVYELGNLL